MSDKLQRLHADISRSLNEIAALFDPKHTPKMTLIIRTPWLEDGDVLMGNDDYDESIAAINRLRSKEPVAAGSGSAPASPTAGSVPKFESCDVPCPQHSGWSCLFQKGHKGTHSWCDPEEASVPPLIELSRCYSHDHGEALQIER